MAKDATLGVSFEKVLILSHPSHLFFLCADFFFFIMCEMVDGKIIQYNNLNFFYIYILITQMNAVMDDK